MISYKTNLCVAPPVTSHAGHVLRVPDVESLPGCPQPGLRVQLQRPRLHPVLVHLQQDLLPLNCLQRPPGEVGGGLALASAL